MRYQKPLQWLVAFIFVFALFAAAMGLFYTTPGEPVQTTSTRGEQVTLKGSGLYAADTVSSAAQMQGNDLVALVVGLPLLAVSAWLAFHTRHGSAWSTRGQLLLAGTLGFFLYTYMSMAFYAAYNSLFLIYVALFSMSLFAFILALLAIDRNSLPERLSPRLPRRAIAVLFFTAAAFLTLAWLGRIVPPLLQGSLPALENTTTLVIQAMDLGLIVPFSVMAGVLLLKRSPWGYLLASVALMKFLTMSLAVSAMGINMILNGVPDSPVIIGIFLLMTAASLVMAVLLLKNVIEPGQAGRTGQKPV